MVLKQPPLCLYSILKSSGNRDRCFKCCSMLYPNQLKYCGWLGPGVPLVSLSKASEFKKLPERTILDIYL